MTQSFMIALIEIVLTTILLLSIGYLLTKNLFLLNDAAESISNKNFDVERAKKIHNYHKEKIFFYNISKKHKNINIYKI
jgi:hypothetical protein